MATTSGPSASGPFGITPAQMRTEIKFMFNKVIYPHMVELNSLLNKPLSSYRTPAQIEADIFKLMAFTDPEPPKDATGRVIVLGNVYSCRPPLTMTATRIKVTATSPTTNEVSGVAPELDAAAAATATPRTFKSNVCSPVTASTAVRRTGQRGGQTTTVVALPSRPFQAGVKSLLTLKEQLDKVRAAGGPSAFDAVITENQTRLAKQNNLISTIDQRIDEIKAAEKGRLEKGLSDINKMITKYQTDKVAASVPFAEFEKDYELFNEMLVKAETRKQELIELFNTMSNTSSSLFYGGKRRRSSRKTRKGVRRH